MSKCEFDFVCHKKWEDLAPTECENARHCNDCNQRVFDINPISAEASVALGRCVRIMTTLGVLIDCDSYFERTKFAINVRLVQAVTDERAAELRQSFRALFDNGETEEQLRDGEIVMLGHVKPYTAMILESEFRNFAPEIVMWGADDKAQQMLRSERERARNRDEKARRREVAGFNVPGTSTRNFMP